VVVTFVPEIVGGSKSVVDLFETRIIVGSESAVGIVGVNRRVIVAGNLCQRRIRTGTLTSRGVLREKTPEFVSDGNRREMSIMNIAAPPAVSFQGILAHQGGWDEILLVAGPIAVIVGLLALVKRRIDAQVKVASSESNDPEGGSSGDVDRSAFDGRSDSA
jgi:hypothetical protein